MEFALCKHENVSHRRGLHGTVRVSVVFCVPEVDNVNFEGVCTGLGGFLSQIRASFTTSGKSMAL